MVMRYSNNILVTLWCDFTFETSTISSITFCYYIDKASQHDSIDTTNSAGSAYTFANFPPRENLHRYHGIQYKIVFCVPDSGTYSMTIIVYLIQNLVKSQPTKNCSHVRSAPPCATILDEGLCICGNITIFF